MVARVLATATYAGVGWLGPLWLPAQGRVSNPPLLPPENPAFIRCAVIPAKGGNPESPCTVYREHERISWIPGLPQSLQRGT